MSILADKSLVIFLVGPTAVGKTEVAFTLAKRIKAEIISCDSMQVYRGMDVGTAKPSNQMRREIPHHLIDILEPNEEYNAADFRKRALELIPQIHSRRKIPLIVGGSGLYMKALVDGLFLSPGADWNLRKELYGQASIHGSSLLYERLKEIDSKTASILHPHDLRRIVRALEVYLSTGIPISRLKEKTKGIDSDYSIKIFGLNLPRQRLYSRIEKRVEFMFNNGLIEESRYLLDRQLSLSCSQCLGYKEAFGYLRGQYSRKEAEELLKRNTRRFAKRQLSWLRKEKRIQWLQISNCQRPEDIAQRIMERL